MTEAELCAAFRAAAEGDGWVVYPEVAGWDLVLVWPGESPVPPGAADIPRGTQVGVEAKLRGNAEVLAQVIGRTRWKGTPRPDFAAVLVPHASDAFETVAGALGVGVYTLRHAAPYRVRRWGDYERERKTIAAPHARESAEPVVRRGTAKRLWLPPVVPTIEAGHPAPSPLTPWRVKAIRLCAILRARGYLTGGDFKDAAVNPQVWRDRWVRNAGKDPEGRGARYVAIAGARLPDVGFEAEAALLADL